MSKVISYMFCLFLKKLPNLVISNISINFVHNNYKPTEDAVYD